MDDRLIYAVTFPFRLEWEAIVWWSVVVLVVLHRVALRMRMGERR